MEAPSTPPQLPCLTRTLTSTWESVVRMVLAVSATKASQCATIFCRVVPQPFVDKSRGILVVYDGQIYNYRDLSHALGIQCKSDGEVLLPLYLRHGPSFVRHLDGEFALTVVDAGSSTVILATDIFSTKPLWYSTEPGLSVASYRSGVLALGGNVIRQVDPNSAIVFKLFEDGSVQPDVQRIAVHEFDLRQFKTDVLDYLQALDQAVSKRAQVSSGHRPFIGLSPGYDSGALQVLLTLGNTSHAAYSVVCTKDVTEIEDRIAWGGQLVEGNMVLPNQEELFEEVRFLHEDCENFTYSGVGRQGTIAADPAAAGLSHMFKEACQRDLQVFLSALGADEILPDFAYGLAEKRTSLKPLGVFPEDLRSIFPWTSFFVGTQRDNLMKEEIIAGAHGIEGRYPFLDKRVVQEYLWLDRNAKNEYYKAPLHQLFQAVKYPFEVGKKVGFNGAYSLKVGEESLKVRQGNLELLENSLQLREEWAQVKRREAELQAANLEVTRLEESLSKRNEELDAEAARSDVDQMQRIQMTLFTIVPRFAAMLHTATPVERGYVFPSPTPVQRVNGKWRSVEIVTCVTGGKDVVVADFPMYRLFRATTPLQTLHNVCEDIKWKGIDDRLLKYEEFFRETSQKSRSKDVLYLVVDGLDLFFNDVSEVSASPAKENLADITSRVIAERYEALASGPPRRDIVMSTERLCGWGGAKFCSPEDEARYPEAPTDSKYLNAGGYIGPAEALSEMISAVLQMKRTATGEHKEKGRMSDQYFFKLYFWDHQDRIALDYHQSIFGNFLEISNRPCESDFAPICAVKPCCTESDNFRRFHQIFFSRYKVKGCAVWRKNNLPISWHGNGAGKWLYLLALDQLSVRCGPAANVTREQMPQDNGRNVHQVRSPITTRRQQMAWRLSHKCQQTPHGGRRHEGPE